LFNKFPTFDDALEAFKISKLDELEHLNIDKDNKNIIINTEIEKFELSEKPKYLIENT